MGTYDPVEAALRRHKQLTEDSPFNRSELPTAAAAQRLALEQAFAGQLPEQWAAIQTTPEWEQLSAESPLHPEQFEAFARQFVDPAEED